MGFLDDSYLTKFCTVTLRNKYTLHFKNHNNDMDGKANCKPRLTVNAKSTETIDLVFRYRPQLLMIQYSNHVGSGLWVLYTTANECIVDQVYRGNIPSTVTITGSTTSNQFTVTNNGGSALYVTVIS